MIMESQEEDKIPERSRHNKTAHTVVAMTMIIMVTIIIITVRRSLPFGPNVKVSQYPAQYSYYRLSAHNAATETAGDSAVVFWAGERGRGRKNRRDSVATNNNTVLLLVFWKRGSVTVYEPLLFYRMRNGEENRMPPVCGCRCICDWHWRLRAEHYYPLMVSTGLCCVNIHSDLCRCIEVDTEVKQ